MGGWIVMMRESSEEVREDVLINPSGEKEARKERESVVVVVAIVSGVEREGKKDLL